MEASGKHSATPWKEIQATPVQKSLDDAKAVSNATKRCAVMTTYSDDCGFLCTKEVEEACMEDHQDVLQQQGTWRDSEVFGSPSRDIG